MKTPIQYVVVRSYVMDILRRIMDQVTVAIHADLRVRQRRVTLRVETKLTLAPHKKDRTSVTHE